MSFYSNWAKAHLDYESDRSYPSPEEQRLRRIDELHERLSELESAGAPYRCGMRLTDDDLLCIDPAYLEAVADTERAIALAVDELKTTYAIDICEIAETPRCPVIPLTPHPTPPKAA